MSDEKLAQKAFNTAGPSLILKFLTQGIQLVVGILLVRFLSPDDYGLWGIIMFFWSIGIIFTKGGFGEALLQKKEISELELSSVFYYNMTLGLVCCLCIILSSNWLAQFFHQPQLCGLLKVVAWTIPINALCSIEHNILYYKLQQHRSNVCIFLGYVVGIPVALYLALHGYGAWSMGWQMLVSSATSSIAVFLVVRWVPKWQFSFRTLQSMFRFGSNLFIAELLENVFVYIYNIVIGKIYPIHLLGYYDRARTYASYWPQSTQWTIGSVLFPAFSKIQDDVVRLKNAFIASMQVSNFVVIFPAMLLATLIYPFTELILSSKWLPIVTYFRIITVSFIFFPAMYVNYSVLNARGKSGQYLWLVTVNKILIIISILCTVWFDIIYMVISMPIVSAISLVINAHYTKREIGYSLFEQLRDNVQYFIYSLIACAGAYGLSQWLYPINKWASLIVPGIVGCLIYAGLNWYFHSFAFDTVWRMGWNQINGWLGRDKKSEENPTNEENPTQE